MYGYDEDKAQLTSIVTPDVVNYSFGYDSKNNLAYRGNNLINQKELFTYDTQNRLTNWDIRDATTNVQLKTNSMSYDVMGNIATKSDLNIPDAVTLKYEEPAHPHALSSISGNPDAISNDNLSVTYTDFRKIKTLTEGTTKQYAITYGVDDQRRRTDYTSNDTTQTRYYLGDYEEESDNNGNVKKIHYLSGGAMLVQNNGVETLYYGYKDNQGSLIALTDQNGIVVEKYAYDPWGARRNPVDWQFIDTRSSFITNRGYTGHEHLDAFNIINMNGRVYDPATAMFFSPDPFIQSPENWMNYNRYSYVMNNPTRSADPTGYNSSARDSDQGNGYDWSWGEGGGGGGGFNRGNSGRVKNWDPYGFHANTYFSDGNTGNYYDWNGGAVSFEEVYNNYILPNSYAISTRSKGDPSGSNNGADKVVDYANGHEKDLGNEVDNFYGIPGLKMKNYIGEDPCPETQNRGFVLIEFDFTSLTGVQNIRAIQIVTTNKPVGGGLYSYFDSDNGTIYFYDREQTKEQIRGNTFSFHDRPWRDKESAIFKASLSIYDGFNFKFSINYGFEIRNGKTIVYPMTVFKPWH